MNTITLAEFAQQHRQDLLTEAAEYREGEQYRHDRRGRRRHRAARPNARHIFSGRRTEAAAR